MSWLTVIWSMAAAACLTLAAVHLRVWWRNRALRASALFSGLAIGVAAYAAIEVWMMRAATPGEFALALRWAHVPTWIIVVGMVEFVRVYLRAGRPWLAWTVIGLRSLALLLNFFVGANLNYLEISRLRQVLFLGETVSIPVGTPNPCMLVGQASLMLFWIFVGDAALAVWRRGERRLAIVVGGSMVCFTMAATAQSVVVFWGLKSWPLSATLCFLPVVVAMGLELSREIFQEAQLRSALHESEQQTLLAAEAAKLGFWVRQIARDEIWASASWRALFGFAETEPLDFARMLERLHPDDREQVRETLLRAQTHGGHYDTQYRLLLPDGRLRWIDSHGRVDFDSAGHPQQVRGVSLDITQRKQTELDALRQREELAQASRVTMLGELSQSLAHELNQPLGAILRNAEAAELYLQNPTPDLDELRAILADIRKDDQRAGSVISRMRALLKQGPPEHQRLDLQLLAEEVIGFVQTDARMRQVRLRLEPGADRAFVRGDPVQLQQVLLNLVLNAMDAMEATAPGGREITVRLRMGDGRVEVAVNDTGPGLPAGKTAQIFEAFFTTKPKGLGLGLRISRSIVEAHGGTIRAENHPQGGASFAVSLPMAGQEIAR